MPARYLFLGLFIGGIGLGWFAVAGRPVVSPAGGNETEQPQRQGSKATTSALHASLGNSGCSAQGCHGAVIGHVKPLTVWGTDPADITRWRESSTIFNSHDPHRMAFDVLKSERSAGIQQRLLTRTAAWEDARCLACHSNPTMAGDQSPAAKTIHADGVSCEACHGNSSGWIDAHTKWTASTDRAKAFADTGMTPLHDMGVRAMTCLGCHVGAPAENDRNIPRRDVNHDLIAAGHPRLNFDFATYMERLPAHWVEKDRGQAPSPSFRQPSQTAWMWGVGRHASNAAAYRLLADRAAQGEKDPRAWPELAENDCFACHRGLNPERQKLSQPPSRITGGLGREAPSLLSALEQTIPKTEAVENLMRRPGQAPAELATAASAAATEWEGLLREMVAQKPAPDDGRRWAGKLAVAGPPMTWAEACQRFYALDLFNRSLQGGEDKTIDELRPLLRFQRDPIEINSPATADLPTAGRKLREIAERLSRPSTPATPPKK